MAIRYCKFCDQSFEKPGNHWLESYSSSKGKKYKTYRCKKHRKNWSKTFYINNLQQIIERVQNWRINNSEQMNLNRRVIYASNPKCRLESSVRSRIYKMVKEHKGSSRYLLYTISDLMLNITLKFKNKMTWENYGKWHIDHIIPIKAKKEDGSYYWNQEELSNPHSETFKKCWSLDNLQPLWAKDNLRKQNHYKD